MPLDLASASIMARDAMRAQFREGEPERPRRAPVRRAGARALRAIAERVEP